MKAMKFNPLARLGTVVVLALVLAACGGSSSTAPEPPPPTLYEQTVAAIAAATTAEAAQAAYDAVKDDVTASEGARLQAAVDARIVVLMTMDRASEQKQALMTAAGNIDTSGLSTQAAIDAAEAAIAALEMALAAATDVSDADKAMYAGQVTAAKAAVATAQGVLDHEAQTTALSNAVGALQAIDLTDLSTQAKIDAANTAIEAVRAALAAATELSATEKTMAMTELAAANRTVMMAQGRFDTASQKMALSEAVAALEALDLDNLMTQEAIDAALAAITGIELALKAATNLTEAEKLDATVDVTVAKRKVGQAEETLAENVGNQRTALMDARDALAAIDLEDLSDQAKIDAADDAVMALERALTAATHLSDSEKAMYQTQLDAATETVRMAQTGMDRDGRVMAQRTAIMNAVTMARTKVGMVDDDATEAEVTAADGAIADLKEAIDGAVDLPEGDDEVASAKGTLATLEGQLASAKKSRMMAMDAKDKAMMADAMADAMKLHKGIGEQPIGGTGEAARTAASAATGVISVTMGTAAAVPLAVDKKTMVPDNHGWMGKKHTAEPTGDVGTYEARVYSDVGDSTPGDPFDEEYADNFANGTLDTVTTSGTASRVASPSFDQSAGVKSFKKGENLEQVVIAGSYHGVAGTYYCTPAADSKCAAQKAESGFTLGGTADANNAFTAGGGTWTFKPSNPKAKVMSAEDTVYASYGWWLHKSEDGMTYTASAFATARGAVPAAAGITNLRGTATYMGGAAGKYALYSSTGGTNDAGHFTARATLEADFNADMITGTIDNFMGADGKSRPWSVELMKQGVGDTGAILGNDGTGTAGTDEKMTKWTIDGTAAAAAGQWSGTLYDNGADSVPKVGTGTFHSTYSTSGRMVGAFGVNKQ